MARSVDYAQKDGVKIDPAQHVGTKSIEFPQTTETVNLPPGPVSVTLGVPAPVMPSAIFNALLMGEVANRGISMYSLPATSSSLISRIQLLMRTEQAILEVYRAQNA